MNVLSIDLDICFEQGGVFREYMNYNIPPEHSWDIMEKLGVDMSIDIDIFTKIKSVVNHNCKGIPVVFINEHDEIINVLEDFNCYKADLYHFDAHHDVGYGGEIHKLNIENWILHAKIRKLVDKVTWTHNVMSEFPLQYPFLMTHDNILDIEPEYLPKMDLLVICTSKQFTPKMYWKTLPEVVTEDITSISYPEKFKEIQEFDFGLLDPYGEYMVNGTDPDVKEIWQNGCLYVVIEKNNRISMFKHGEGTSDMFSSYQMVDYAISKFGYCVFEWIEGGKNEKFVKRLASQYLTVKNKRSKNSISIIGKKVI